jgi:hypothetical protein
VLSCLAVGYITSMWKTIKALHLQFFPYAKRKKKTLIIKNHGDILVSVHVRALAFLSINVSCFTHWRSVFFAATLP